MNRIIRKYLALLPFLLSPMGANAAFISIDDSDLDTITIFVNDFEGCFSVNGVELSCGLGDPQSITLADGDVYSFSGSWIDLGATVENDGAHYFGLLGELFSGVEWSTSRDGPFATIEGAFAAFDLFTSYGPIEPLNPQDGSARDFSQPFLSASFISEVAAVPVPEPGTLALLGVGLFGMGLARRRKTV